jgi:hypothetical protein
MGETGVPLSYVIRAAIANPEDAPDEYTQALWAASFEPRQYHDDSRGVYLWFKDLLTKTEGQTWFEKVKNDNGRAAHLLLGEHYAGEAHNQRHATSALAKLEHLDQRNESSFPFEKYLTCLNEAFVQMEDAEATTPLSCSKVHWLNHGIKNDDIQVQTTSGIICDRYLTNFDEACLTQKYIGSITESKTMISKFKQLAVSFATGI